MRYEIALSAMNLIASLGREGFLDGVGVSRGDFDRLTGDAPWMSSDRNRMTATLNTLLNASVDALGLPRFNLPAEFVAAGISVFVQPINVHAAAAFCGNSGSVEDGARGTIVSPATPEQIFALCVMLYGSQGRNSARAQFEKNTKLAIDKVNPGLINTSSTLRKV